MKFIHTADVHLGSGMDSRFNREISLKRKEEVRSTFKRMADYAVNNGVTAIILAGDVFDSDSPFKRDKEFFYSVVKNNPQIDFLYLKGNHDTAAEYGGETPQNLKTFGPEWQSYRYGNAVISGVELSAENSVSAYSSLSLGESDVNIVVLHGQAGDSSGKDRVNLKKLRGKNIDYLALGHVHKFSEGTLDGRGEYAYCGCPEGRGFDETGEHGFVLLTVEEGVKKQFIPFCERRITEKDVSVSGVADAYAAYKIVKESANLNGRDIYRINLRGEVDFRVENMASDVKAYLEKEDLYFYVDVKDLTVKKLDISAFEKDASVRGEFVRCVMQSPDCTEEQKKAIIALGFKALKGERDV